jgi:hypothetical protein
VKQDEEREERGEWRMKKDQEEKEREKSGGNEETHNGQGKEKRKMEKDDIKEGDAGRMIKKTRRGRRKKKQEN